MELFLSALLPPLLLQVLSSVRAYPSGAPTGACEDMTPRHGVPAQSSPSPYVLITNSRVFQPGKAITVTISGPEYRGVLLEARSGNSFFALGTWQNPPPDTKFLQCTDNPYGAITHANTNVKGNATVYSWMPPDIVTPVYFVATVAQQRTVFWVNVRSNVMARGKERISLATDASVGLADGKHFVALLTCLLMRLLLH
ncbi:putative defense protein Hdd11 [Dunckerocampus dactyliophorus]|uniref:putative defense protein Hdd11 n=1 Tax=Dunckerocampus dactyliophorus TaxID=161453 RepID=UPI002404D607|nr:putative defense protein Hdd11 [Dunckerocampus dactyliophorus]